MVDYIFSILKSQARFNRTVIACAIAMTAYATIQSKKIKKLENEIKELKDQRGE